MPLPAIIIPAYNRPACLKRLLESVSQAVYSDNNITLVISIDQSNSNEIYDIAESFTWPHGKLEIIKHKKHYGLKEHILWCGDLTEKYGSVIILEDDLLVSPLFYSYTKQAMQFCSLFPDERIAGVSLYNYEIAESSFCPFEPFDDGYDNYFIQVASSWGQCWTNNMWGGFRSWFANNAEMLFSEEVPDYLRKWGQHSWKKHFIRYLISTGKYFLFPRISLSTNFGDPGTNTDRKGLFQVRLLTHEKKFQFSSLSQSLSVHDSSFEMEAASIKKLCKDFEAYDFAVDLYGTKDPGKIKNPYLLSSQNCSVPQKTFGSELHPSIFNVLSHNAGSAFSLGKTEYFSKTEVDKSIFYESIDSVLEIVFEKKIKALSEERLKKEINAFRQHEEFKELAVVVLNDKKGDEFKKTLLSIAEQNYPHVNVFFIDFENASLDQGVLDKFQSFKITKADTHPDFKKLIAMVLGSTSQYAVMIYSGGTFAKNTFNIVNNIFKQFNNIHFLNGSSKNEEELRMGRLNESIFVNRWNNKQKVVAEPNGIFITRYLMEKAIFGANLEKATSFESFLLTLFSLERMYVTDSTFINEVGNRAAQSIPQKYSSHWNMIDTITASFFMKNISPLRYFFKNRQGLSPVIRHSKQNSNFFLSDY